MRRERCRPGAAGQLRHAAHVGAVEERRLLPRAGAGAGLVRAVFAVAVVVVDGGRLHLPLPSIASY